MPHNINLGKDKWECALCTFSYSHSWYDIEEGECYLEVDMPNKNNVFTETASDSHVSETEQNITRKITLGSGQYGDEPLNFVNTINSKLGEQGAKSKFVYDDMTNKVCLITRNEETVTMSTPLASLLGFSHTAYAHSKFHLNIGILSQRHEGTNMIDFSLKTHNLFIYCDIIENTLLGGYYHPLLAIVPTKRKNYNTYVTNTYTDKHYITLNANTLSRIKIRICDDQDENIKFNGGRTALKLHFRPKNL